MPSKERRERERAKAKSLQETAKALASTKPAKAFGFLPPEQIAKINMELAAGAERYCIRGVKFAEFGCVIPPKNWGKNDTGRQNRLAADHRCGRLREAAGPRWGKSQNIPWLMRKAVEIGLGALSAKTIRAYFKRMP